MKKSKNPVVFLDRDGVINQKRNDYVKKISEFVFLPNSINAINELNKIGFLVIIVTNQSAINRGIISKEKLDEIHEYMLNVLEEKSCKIARVYYCPHLPKENCGCRKPKTGMFEKAIKEFNIDISKSFLIGDDNTDIQAADLLGLKSYKIKTNGNLLEIVKVIKDSLSEQV